MTRPIESPAASLTRYDANVLASFNAARKSHGLEPVSSLPGSSDASIEAAAVVAASVGWDD